MTVGITWRDLVDIVLFEEGLKERTTGGMSTNAQCTKGRPVITLPSRDELRPWGVFSLQLNEILPTEFERTFNRLGTGTDEQRMRKCKLIPKDEFTEFLDARSGIKPGVDVIHRLQLSRYS
jgi:hypothetical protein